MGAGTNRLSALVAASDDRASVDVRRARRAIIVCLAFGFAVPILRIPGLIGLLHHTLGLSPIVAWGLEANGEKLFVLCFVPLAVLWWERRPLASIGLKRPTVSEAALGFGVFIMTEIAALSAAALTALIERRAGGGGTALGSPHQFGGLLALPIGLGLAGAVINGITEELVARGYAISRLEAATGSTIIAATLALVADVAIHIPYWGVRGAMVLAPAQLVFVLTFLWRGDLTACIAGHILNDALPYLIIAAVPAWMALAGHTSYATAAGESAYLRRDYATAVARLTDAIKANPRDSTAYNWRASAYLYLGQSRSAIDDYTALVRLKPNDPNTQNALAWELATSDDAALRDGPRAVGLAERACALTAWKDPAMLDTLAASYAESGNFAKAVDLQRRALALAGKNKSDLGARLELYLRHQPYHAQSGALEAQCGCGVKGGGT